MALHGHADDPADLAGAVADLATGSDRVLVAPTGPVVLADGTRAWFAEGDDGEGARLLDHLGAVLDEAAQAHGADPTQAVLVGFSQGAAAALTAAVAEGGPRLGAVAAVAGWLPDLDGVAWAPRPDVPVLLVHGTDDEVVPLPLGRSAARYLERSGAPVTWREHEAGHRLTAPMVADVATWLHGLDQGEPSG